MRPICYLTLLAAALGCQAAPPPDTTAEATQAIDAANANWPRLTAAGTVDPGVAGLRASLTARSITTVSLTLG